MSVPVLTFCVCFFFFSSRRRHTRLQGDWSSDVCSSDLQECPQFRLCIRRSRLVSSLYLHVQHHPDIGYEVTMIGVRRSSRLSRVISHLGVLLMSVQWLHGAIHI